MGVRCSVAASRQLNAAPHTVSGVGNPADEISRVYCPLANLRFCLCTSLALKPMSLSRIKCAGVHAETQQTAGRAGSCRALRYAKHQFRAKMTLST